MKSSELWLPKIVALNVQCEIALDKHDRMGLTQDPSAIATKRSNVLDLVVDSTIEACRINNNPWEDIIVVRNGPLWPEITVMAARLFVIFTMLENQLNSTIDIEGGDYDTHLRNVLYCLNQGNYNSTIRLLFVEAESILNLYAVGVDRTQENITNEVLFGYALKILAKRLYNDKECWN